MDGHGTTTTAPLALLSIAEARAILGVARSTLYEIIASGELEIVEIRGRRLIEPATLTAFIERGRRRGATR
jgi:excisionase family DNA binding protein